MQSMIDCDVLEYSRAPEAIRVEQALEWAEAPVKPVFVLPTFELCRAFHLLVKYDDVSPTDFRMCWAEFSEAYWGDWLHISDYPETLFPDVTSRLFPYDAGRGSDDEEVPCEGSPIRYWDNYRSLVRRLRALTRRDVEEIKFWDLHPPVGRSAVQQSAYSNPNDVVVDTNNLLELLNQLPEDGRSIATDDLHLPRQLSSTAIRKFKQILDSQGLSGKFIIPLSVLEETERVAKREHPRYAQALKVLGAISLSPERPLWTTFSFDPLTQDIFDCLIHLYARLHVKGIKEQIIPGFGDALVLAHAIYHRCPVASNEWYDHAEDDEWLAISRLFPELVLA